MKLINQLSGILLFSIVVSNVFSQEVQDTTITDIRGYVFDADSKEPLSLVRVKIPDGTLNDPSTTGSDGKFHIKGTFHIGREYTFICTRQRYKDREIRLRVNKEGRLDDISLTRDLIPPKDTIKGIVHDWGDNPISGVIVNISDGASREALTNENGKFELIGKFVPGSNYTFNLIKQGYEKLDTTFRINKDHWLGLLYLEFKEKNNAWPGNVILISSLSGTGFGGYKLLHINNKIENTNTQNEREVLQKQKEPWSYIVVVGGIGVLTAVLIKAEVIKFKQKNKNVQLRVESNSEYVGMKVSCYF